MLGQYTEEALQLRFRILGRFIHVHQALDFRQAQAKSFAVQGQLQTGTLTRRVDPVTATTAFSFGTEQALIFVEADRTWRDIELLRQFSNRVGRHDAP